MRRQAYASLAAFGCETQEEIGALRPRWHFVALLRHEQQQQQAARVSGQDSRWQRRQLRLAAAECEALVQAALAHEHATRRRAAATVAPAGGSATTHERGRGPASAAGGAPAMSHRLQSVLPKQLLGGSSASATELLQRLPEMPAAAVLYFYAPPPPPGSASRAATTAAARQAASDYQAVFGEVLRQQPLAPAAAEHAGAATESLAAWSAFLRRWLAAKRAADRQQDADAAQAATDAALQAWHLVQEALRSGAGAPAAAASAVWAAAALCGCTPQPLQRLVAAVHAALLGIATGQAQAAAVVQRAAVAALGSTAEALRVAAGVDAVQQLVQLLQGRLFGKATAAGDIAAAATGLGLACKALGGTGSGLPPAAQDLLRSGISTLVQLLSAAWPEACSTVAAAAAADGLALPPLQSASVAEVLSAVAEALAAALPVAAPALALPSLLRGLHQLLSAQLSQPAAASEAAACAALCSLLAAVAATGFATSALGSSDTSGSLRLLLSLAEGDAAATDGRLVGTAAAAAGSLLASALQHGFAPAADEGGADAVLQRLVSVPEAAARLAHAAAAKRGAAAGLAALLSSGAVDLATSAHYKSAGGWMVDGASSPLSHTVRLACPSVRSKQACAMRRTWACNPRRPPSSCSRSGHPGAPRAAGR